MSCKSIIRVIGLALVLAILFNVSYALPDPSPTLTIYADKSDVETVAIVHVIGRDAGLFSGVESITLKEDGKTIGTQSCAGVVMCTFDRTIEHWEKGRHVYSAFVKDRGGNIKTGYIYVNFRGAFPPPILTIVENPYVEENMHIVFRMFAYDFDDKPLNISATGLPNGATFRNNVLEWTPTFEQSGKYTITFSAIDSKNHKTTKKMILDVKDVNRPPTVIVSEPSGTNYEINEDSSMIFSINVSDPDNKKQKIEWLLDGRSVSTGNTYVYKTKFNTAGKHTLLARVKDGDYLKRIVWNLSVRDVNRPPVMRDLPDKTLKEGQTLRLTIRGSDPDKDILTYEATKMPNGAKFDPDTGKFEWTAIKPGYYEASFRVRDKEGYSAGTGFEIIVKEKSEKEKLEELYQKALEAEEERKRELQRSYEEDKNKTSTTPANPVIPIIVQSPTSCNSGYLCYNVTYFG